MQNNPFVKPAGMPYLMITFTCRSHKWFQFIKMIWSKVVKPVIISLQYYSWRHWHCSYNLCSFLSNWPFHVHGFKEAAAHHNGKPTYGPEPKDRHHIYWAGTYPLWTDWQWWGLWPSSTLDKWSFVWCRKFCGLLCSWLCFSDVRVGPEIVTDSAFLVTRWVVWPLDLLYFYFCSFNK